MVAAQTRNAVADAALQCLQRGWTPVRIPSRAKNPGADGSEGWQKRRYTPEAIPDAFGPRDNIGVIVGSASGGLADLDLDAAEARELARAYAPATARKHGRASSPRSHWWYLAPGAVSKKFQFTFSPAKEMTCLVEIRADGKQGGALQTVIPPSIHPNGETYQWELADDGKPASVDTRDLEAAAGRIAAGALLARLWPAKGSRDDTAMALAGWLLRPPFSWSVEETDIFAQKVAYAAGDEEHRARAKAKHTRAALDSGDKDVTGRPTLERLLGADGPRACAVIAEWLGLGATQQSTFADSGADSDTSDAADAKDAADANSQKVNPGRAPAIAAQLVKIAEYGAELWHDGDGMAWATFTTSDGHSENWPLTSRSFRRWLSSQFYAVSGQSPSAQPMADALLTLDGRAANDGPQYAVYTRLAEQDGAIYLDLADTQWRAVCIRPSGWEIVSNPPVRFRRAKGMEPLPIPTRGGSLDDLRPFVNVADQDAWPLVKAWLIAALRPSGPYPVLAVSGEMGSAKTMLGRILRALVDPNAAPIRSAPRDDRDLAITAKNGWVIALDNLSHIPGWLSDALCRLSTGGGFATRALYENDEEVIIAAKRPIIFTGIEEVATRGDLIDRALLLALEPIPDAKRQTERALWAAFEAARPTILGALLDMVARALKRLPQVNLAKKPRMADFAEWAVAAENCGLDGSESAFLKAYEDNRAGANSVALDASPVAEQLLKFMEDKNEWEDTPTRLYDALSAFAGEKVTKGPSWPKNARALSGALKRLAPNLRREGIEIAQGHSGDKRRARRVTIERVCIFASAASAASAENANPENDGAEASDFADATADAKFTADANAFLRPQLRPQLESRIEAGSGAPADAADAADAKIHTLPYATYACERPDACAGRTLNSGRWACSICEAQKTRASITAGAVNG